MTTKPHCKRTRDSKLTEHARRRGARTNKSSVHRRGHHVQLLSMLVGLASVIIAAALRVRAADRATPRQPLSSPQHWPRVTRKQPPRN